MVIRFRVHDAPNQRFGKIVTTRRVVRETLGIQGLRGNRGRCNRSHGRRFLRRRRGRTLGRRRLIFPLKRDNLGCRKNRKSISQIKFHDVATRLVTIRVQLESIGQKCRLTGQRRKRRQPRNRRQPQPDIMKDPAHALTNQYSNQITG